MNCESPGFSRGECQEAALHRKLSWKKLKWLRNAQRRGLGAERGVTPDAERAAYERWIDARRRLVAAHAKLRSYYHTDSDPRMRNRPATTESQLGAGLGHSGGE